MKPIFLSLFFMGVYQFGLSQGVDGPENHLRYSDEAMTVLRDIGSRRQAEFDASDDHGKFESISFARGHYVKLKRDSPLIALIKAGATWEEVRSQLRSDDIFIQEVPLIRNIYVDDQGEKELRIRSAVSLNFRLYLSSKETQNVNARNFKGLWLTAIEGKQYFEAVYFLEDFHKEKLAPRYGKHIAYAQHMIDPGSSIFLKPKGNGEGVAVKAFMDMITYHISEPEYSSDDYDVYLKRMAAWTQEREQWLETTVIPQKEFLPCLRAAAEEGARLGTSNNQLEDLVEEYISGESALALKRRRRLMMRCGNDNSPMIHLSEIKRLAAETGHWDVFLRSYFDMINDFIVYTPVDETSMPELEALEIDTISLLLGITFEFSSVEKGRYVIRPIGFGLALDEGRERDEFERQVIAFIKDEGLDPVNRVRFLQLYISSLHQIGRDEAAMKFAALDAEIEAPAIHRYILDQAKAYFEE